MTDTPDKSALDERLTSIETRLDELIAAQEGDRTEIRAKLGLMDADTIAAMNARANDSYLRTRRQAQCSLQQIVVLTECYQYLKGADAPLDKIVEFLDAYVYCVDNWPMSQWGCETSVDDWLGRLVASRRACMSGGNPTMIKQPRSFKLNGITRQYFQEHDAD